MENNGLIEKMINLFDSGQVDLSAFSAQGAIPRGKMVFVVSDDRALSRSFSLSLFRQLNSEDNPAFLFVASLNDDVDSKSLPIPQNIFEKHVSFTDEKNDFLRLPENSLLIGSLYFCPVAYSDLRGFSRVANATDLSFLAIIVEKQTKKRSIFEFNQFIATFGGGFLGTVYLGKRLFKTGEGKTRRLH